MSEQAYLVNNVRDHMSGNHELREDLRELHTIGAKPRFRAPTPTSGQLRGLPRNPADAEYMMDQLWQYVRDGEMPTCTQSGSPPTTRRLSSPSTTVAEKLPDGTLSRDKRALWAGDGWVFSPINRTTGS